MNLFSLSDNDTVNQICTVLLSTSVFVGGAMAMILDNTVPGTDTERGIISWNMQRIQKDHEADPTYNLPFCTKILQRSKWTRYIPLCPAFAACGSGEVICDDSVVSDISLEL